MWRKCSNSQAIDLMKVEILFKIHHTNTVQLKIWKLSVFIVLLLEFQNVNYKLLKIKV